MKNFLRAMALTACFAMLFLTFAACNSVDENRNTTASTGSSTTKKSTSGTTNGTASNNNGDNGNGSNTEIKDSYLLALEAWEAYTADSRADAALAGLMIYDAKTELIALKNGESDGVKYSDVESAIEALVGEAAPYCELVATYISGLYYCAMQQIYSYPLYTLPEPNGAIDSYKDGKYVSNGNRYASLIPLKDIDYDRVTIKNGSKDGVANLNFAYTFLAEEPVLDQMPVYAKGYSYVIVVEPVQTLTVNIPEDAEYLYVYHHTRTGKYYFPDEVVFSKSSAPKNSFTLATWNTGNFSGGGKNTTITDSQLEQKKKLYTDFIENRLDADLICLNEFDPKFTTSGNYATKDVLFSGYDAYVGVKNGYQCNSMFADPSLDMTAPKAESDERGYGYYATEITVGGKSVTVVSVHLNYDHNYVKGTTDEVNKAQILRLIDLFKNKERVIFLGDWNCIQFKQYDLLEDAGYSLVNTDPDLHTKTGGAIENRSLDNIAYKGVRISNFSCEITDLSDHFGLRCTVSVD